MSEQDTENAGTENAGTETLRHLAAEWRKAAEEYGARANRLGPCTEGKVAATEAGMLRQCAAELDKCLPAPPGPVRVTSRGDLVHLARELGVRPDWHEPDEQGVSAKVHGVTLDNAGFWGTNGDEVYVGEGQELWVSLHRDGKPVAQVNLADLLAWASAPRDL